MGFNAKLFEVVLYADSSDFDSLKSVVDHRSGLRNYAYIIHDKDDKKIHCHIMMRMNNSYNSDNIAKWFDVKPNQVERCKGRWSDMLAYLIHANASEKFQYDPALVVSNFEWQKEAEKVKNNGTNKRDEVARGIGSGDIKKFNIHDFVSINEYCRFKSYFNSAFEYRLRKIKGVDRDMKCIYIYGGSGTGKTTFAKQIAKDKDYSIYISSGSNDVLDDYEGQSCLILDDLRPSCLGLSDLLKMLDPNTSSSVKSRFYNKVLECEMIIITTTMPIEAFFKNVFENEDEPLRQLQRRCETKIKMTRDQIFVSMYNQKKGEYNSLPSAPNIVLANMELPDMTMDQMINRADDLFKSFGGFAKALKNKKDIDNSVIVSLNKVFPPGHEVGYEHIKKA
jgi:hypothetical protein